MSRLSQRAYHAQTPKKGTKRERFVKEYLVDRNATKAAIRAGYSAKTARQIGSKLLTKIDIQAAVDKGADKIANKLEITAEYILSVVQDITERSRTPGDEYQSFAALKGAELLGKYKKLWTEKTETQISGQLSIMTDAEIEAKLDELRGAK